MKQNQHAAYLAIKAQLIDRTGHHYYADKDDQLRERVGQRARETSEGDLVAYRNLLDSDGEAEWRRLESAVTINETFFFRFADQFAALRGHILPDLVRRRAGSKRLRVWSAGCSTGAEPYSLAVLIHDVLGERLTDWTVSILGTDIDESALSTAREGKFGEWALRTVSEDQRNKLFVLEGRHWTICPQYRAMVRFERQNLVELEGGGGALQLSDFDLILCRNVLIYFSTDRARRLVDELGRRLTSDGWLLIGHAEPTPSEQSGLTAHRAGGVIGWRPLGDSGLARPDVDEAPERPAPVRTPGGPKKVLAPSLERPEPAGALAATRHCLRLGLLDDALMHADAAIGHDPVSAVGHFLRGIVLAGLDRTADAIAALRRALYLDPTLAMAHYLSGVLLLGTGQKEAARRAFRNAATSLDELPAEVLVPEGEGMTVTDLRAALRWRLAEQAR